MTKELDLEEWWGKRSASFQTTYRKKYMDFSKKRNICDSQKWSEDEVRYKRLSKYEAERKVNSKYEQISIGNPSSQESFKHLKAGIEKSHYGIY